METLTEVVQTLICDFGAPVKQVNKFISEESLTLEETHFWIVKN